MLKNILFVLIFGFCLLSLKVKAQELSQNSEVPKDLIITLERIFNCGLSDYKSGKCRDYSLEIKANGDVSLRIEETYKRKAKDIKTKINQKQIKQLIDIFGKVNFFQLQDEYTDGDICKIRATERPTEVISIQIDGKKKQVDHYLGCYIDEKEIVTLLIDLGNKIDEIVETKRWVGERK